MSRRVALIGNPLRRPHSAVMHNAAFDHFGIDARYELHEIGPDQVGPFALQARGDDWYGFQVTAPYKEAIVAHLDRVEESAAEIEAVNSVLRTVEGELVGFNTDAPGFLASVEKAGVSVVGVEAVVVGAGGAARAVVWGLLRSGASRVVIANRTVERAEALAASLARFGSVTGVSLRDASLDDALQKCRLAVNATTVGMTSGGVSFDVSKLSAGAAVFDLVYVPPVTSLVEQADARGLTVRNGLDMLVSQAAIAFQRWTGEADPAPVMRAAVEEWVEAQGT